MFRRPQRFVWQRARCYFMTRLSSNERLEKLE
jgi:hypothetical protein